MRYLRPGHCFLIRDPDCRRRFVALFLSILPLVSRAAGPGPLLKDALDAIAASGVRVIYSTETVPPDLRAQGPPIGDTVAERLQSLLSPLHLEARPLPGGYVVVPARRSTASLVLTVSGTNGERIEPVGAALVSIEGSHRRARTDLSGRATLSELASGVYTIRIQAEGFQSIAQMVRIDPAAADVPLDVHLERESPPLAQVVVETSRYDVTADSSNPIARDALESNPITADDAARALQLLPGVAVAGYTARTHVRGSRDDETLFRYDGVTLNDPYHLGEVQSLFSAIDPATVDSVTAWTGIAPIQFGGRIGAVVDIQPRRISSPALDVKLSEQNASVLAGTPFDDERGTVFIAARMGNGLAPVGWFDEEVSRPTYNDVVLRATWSWDSNTRIVLGALGIDDQRQVVAAGAAADRSLSGRELYTWLRVFHDFPHGVRSETLLSSEDSHDFLNGAVDQPNVAVGFLHEHDRRAAYTFREELIAAPASRWVTRVGVEAIEFSVNDRTSSQAQFFAPFFPGLQPQANVREDSDVAARATTSSLYGDLRWQATDALITELGLRRDARKFESLRSETQWNVRVNTRWNVTDETTLRVGWGQESQTDVFGATAVADGPVQPPSIRRLTQSNISLERSLRRGWRLRAEAYAKREGSPFTAAETAFSPFTLISELSVDSQIIATQRSRMRGLELSLQTDAAQPISGSLSYTRSRAEDLINSQWLPRSWDQPNAVDLDALWRRGPWHLAAVLSWHTGWPTTPLIASSTTWTDPAAVNLALGPWNSTRFGSFFSLDLRAAWEHPWGDGLFQAFLQIYDATGASSPCCRSYSVAGSTGGPYQLVATQAPWLRFTPIVGIRWRH